MKATAIFRILCGTFLLTLSIGNIMAAASPLPEDYKTSITMQPAITKVIIEDDIQDALIMLNKMHSVMAENGWELYQLIEYLDDEDFEGFFVTYKKSKQL